MFVKSLLVVLLLWPASTSTTSDLASLLATTWQRLSWKGSLVLDSGEQISNDFSALLKLSGGYGQTISRHAIASFMEDFSKINCTAFSCDGLPSANYITLLDHPSTLPTETVDTALKLGRHFNPYHVLLATTRPEAIAAFMSEVELVVGVYLLDLETGEVFRYLTIRNHDVIINRLKFDSSRDRYVTESYDFQGAALTSLTLPYLPYVIMENCSAVGSDCETSGALFDAVELIGRMHNFTPRVSRAAEWGAVPASGSYGAGDAVFVGAMGAVVNATCDFGLGLWVPTAERGMYLDLSLGVTTQYTATAINRALSRLDVTLFLRPFTPAAWALVAATAAVVAAAILLPPWGDDGDGGDGGDCDGRPVTSRRVVVISAWAFFILVNAFYGGALTMFFSSAPSPPFQSVREAMNSYPEWKMTLPDSQLILIDFQAKELKDPPFVQFYERAEKEGQTEILPMEESLAMLRQPGRFVYSTLQPMVSAYVSNPPSGVDLQIVTRDRGYAGVLILPRRSPLTRAFDVGLQRLRQTGTMDVILSKWEAELKGGAAAAAGGSLAEAEALAGGQAGLVFIVYGMMAAAAAAVMAGECVWARMRSVVKTTHRNDEVGGRMIKQERVVMMRK